MNHKTVKRHVTLLEVMIAMFLTAIVLGTLLFFYKQTSMIGIDIDKIKAEHFNLRYVENRLSAILPRTINEKNKKEFTFFSLNDDSIGMPGSQSLIFAFDNDVSRDSVFSNNVIGRIFVDKQGRLTLAYWPTPQRHEKGTPIPIKKEILLEGVDSLSFEFFIPPERKDDKPQGKPSEKISEKSSEKPSPEPKGGWRKQLWSKEFNTIPAMIKLHVGLKNGKGKKDKESVSFIFPLVNSPIPIIYDQ